ncbi:MAG: NAD(P)-binding protein [Myxococcales bacterium]|nr:NAD(P)-binding protein [Myxococcales bacterium]
MSSGKTKKKRLVALGGGLGNLAALFAITELPGWQDRFDITLYQIGWRLGGRARSGRNLRVHMRSEAFGSHVWWGCYDNAFALLRRCYKELARPAGAPLSTFREAWRPAETLLVATGGHRRSGRQRLWPLTIARNDAAPGECDSPPPAVWDYVQILLPWVLDCLPGLHPDYTSYAALAAGWPEQSRAILPALLRRAQAHGVQHAPEGFDPRAPDYDVLLRSVGERVPAGPLGSRQRRAWAQPLVVCAEHSLAVLESAGARELHPQFMAMLDLAMAVVRGIIHDGLDRAANGFSAADDHDLRAWLRHHRASQTSLANPVVAGFYDMLLAYEGGDPERPSVAAGAALRLVLRALLAHRGALYYTPAADLGETVFAPLYQVLRRRGVRFRFFHKIKQLKTDGERVTAVRIGRQVELDPGIDDYEPLITVKGVPCWPSRPVYNQIILGDSPLIQALDFESPDSPEIEEITLRLGADFDDVLLGIPGPALPRICGELVQQQPRWKAALEHAAAAPTCGVQLWLTPTWAQLAGHAHAVSAGSLPEGNLRRFANRSSLVSLENWPREHKPGTVAALDGPFADPARDDTPASRDAVRDLAWTWLKSQPRRLWPEAALATADEINWELLVDPGGRADEHRLAAQHCWSLGTAADRHTLTLPGSTRHRLRPDDTGFKNLLLAGDWLAGGLDLGCAESAVIAGLQAARALCGHPLAIVGEADIVDTSEDPGASQSLRLHTSAFASAAHPSARTPALDVP